MTPQEDLSALADQICQAGSEWLVNAKHIADAIPFVYQAVQTSQQFSQSFSTAPRNISIEGLQPVITALNQTVSLFDSPQFKLTSGTLPLAISGAAIIASGSNCASGAMGDAIRSGDTNLRLWAEQNLVYFEHLQTSEDNKAFIRTKLARLYGGSDLEFDQALSEYFKTATGATAPSSAAIAMRNVLESLNGNFLQLARRYTTSTVRSWTEAALVVARGAPASVQTSQLLSQKMVYDELHDSKLTKIAKNDWLPSKSEWDAVFSQFIGFLFAVLGLIDLRDGL